ncbi:DUF6126 family protein [Actinacidiphila acididurans]|jgi:hypothetical protein|uniref:Small hydrophobic protein n=1 Tax=Actinacidiphila acididurans TaxID=2784346 RepID=A0ABS2TWC4_9ACTN|nr:DUF6126 family protein [Actinacidiphila acididurans]MBM9507643.1 hypothetical protein [Actinacidiphila acididurans]
MSDQDEPPREAPGGSERWKEKAVRMRVIFYIAGTHVLAAVLILFFWIGSHTHK